MSKTAVKTKAVDAPPAARAATAKAYSYIRMSTKEQIQGDSIRRQVDKTRSYAREHNLELVENYDDIGVSAFRGRNAEQGALRRFMDAVDNGDIPKGSHLVIESMDRLTRQTAMTAVALMSAIIDAGIVIVTLDNKMSYSAESVTANGAQLFIAIGEMMRAHEESRRKSGLLSDAWTEKRKQLRLNGKVITSRVPAWLATDKGVVETIPKRVAVVKEIFEMACNGFGTYSIAKTLNARGEKGWGSTKRTIVRGQVAAAPPPMWHESYIKKILTNRAVLGEFQPHRIQMTGGKRLRIPDGEMITGYYPQVITHEVFRDANLAMARRRVVSRGRKGAVYSNIFSGLLHCARCGSGMRFIDKGPPPRGGKYLRCSRTVSGGDCTTKVYRYELIEQTILSFLESLDLEKALGGNSLSKRLAEMRHQQAMLEIDMKSVEEKIGNTVVALTEGASPSLAVKLRELEQAQAAIATKIRSTEDEINETLLIDPVKRKQVLKSLLKLIGEETEREARIKARRALAGELQRMIESIVIRPDLQFAHEIAEVDESWKKRYRVSTQSRLQRYLDEFGFEIVIRTRSHIQQVINGVNQSQLKLKWNRKFSDFRLLAKHES